MSRGGLLEYDNDNDMNTIRSIAAIFPSRDCGAEQEHYDSCLDVMKELRDRKLFFKEDIQREDLMGCLLNSVFPHRRGEASFFDEERFRYIVNWDPMSLSRENERKVTGILPLHRSVIAYGDIKAFPTVFELGIHHFPTKFGFLFHMDNRDRTPFGMACDKFGRDQVVNAVENVLSMNSYSSKTILEFLVSLAVDESVHLNGVYFLLRRDPCLMARTVSGARGSGHQKRQRETIIGDEANNEDRAGKGKRKK